MLVQPVLAAEDFTQDEIRQIIAKTENDKVASAVGKHCLLGDQDPTARQEQISEPTPCSCALSFRDVKTPSGFEVLFKECADHYRAEMFEKLLEGHEQLAKVQAKRVDIALKQIQTQVSKCWSLPSAKTNGP